MAKVVKGEPARKKRVAEEMRAGEPLMSQGVTERRAIRSSYNAVKNIISDEREEISRVDSGRFTSIMTDVETLYQMVQRPREQVTDAETLENIADSLVALVRPYKNGGVTSSDFVTALLRNFGQYDGIVHVQSSPITFSWKKLGITVSQVFRKAPGCCTMIGPIVKSEVKERKPSVYRKLMRPTPSTQPKEIIDCEKEGKTDTDKNMSVMFEILRQKKSVRLESLVLNRTSFAQTVENIFALSFLVKDGRAEISVNQSGHHLVSPRNGPAASAVVSGEVSYSHFVFRFDFSDWKLMGEISDGELMPHRSSQDVYCTLKDEEAKGCSQPAASMTPIRKYTRNRGFVTQVSVLNGSPRGTSGDTVAPEAKCKLLF